MTFFDNANGVGRHGGGSQTWFLLYRVVPSVLRLLWRILVKEHAQVSRLRETVVLNSSAVELSHISLVALVQPLQAVFFQRRA